MLQYNDLYDAVERDRFVQVTAQILCVLGLERALSIILEPIQKTTYEPSEPLVRKDK